MIRQGLTIWLASLGAMLLYGCGSSSAPATGEGSVSASSGSSPTFSAGPTSFGNVQMSDGTKLFYYLQLPAGGGTFPTLFVYDPYTAGSDVQLVDNYTSFVAEGYAVIGVNLPGTGCSTGTFSVPDATTWGYDGAQVVEWIARQSWSNGHVGMVGGSFGGISQLGVAGFTPPHLDAISPLYPLADFYRDTVYPGGIFNYLWTDEFTLVLLTVLGDVSAVDGVANLDTSCAILSPQQDIARVLGNDALAAPQHPYYDAVWNEAPIQRLANIHIPVLACQTWQDGAVGSDGEEMYFGDPLNPETTWFEGNNGGHGTCLLPDGMLDQFLARYVKGIPNGFENTPHVTLQHEVSTKGISTPLGIGSTSAAGWTSTITNWPDDMQPITLHLHTGGAMDANADTGSGVDTYKYPLLSSTNGEVYLLVPGQLSGWQIYDAPDGSVSYTTPALAQDAEFFGPASVNLWFSSTASDTDVQVTLSEIRPDGMEQYIERGWLRMSHRALDAKESTAVRPYQTNLRQDAEPLTPGSPTYARIEIRPFDHVFRQGSSIRLTIEAPTGITYGDAFSFLATPATNAIYHSAAQDSQLVLGLVPGAVAEKPLPACNTVDFEPCRKSLGTVPAGQLVLPP